MVNNISDIEEDRSVVLRQLYRVQEELEYVYLHGGLGGKGEELDIKISKLKEEKQKVLIQLRYVNYCLALQEKEIKKSRDSVFGKLSNIIFSLNKKSKKRQSAKNKVEEDIKLILLSNYFDDEWYLEQYPDVKASGINPAEHYLQHGSKEGRKPSQLFDGEWYLEAYPDERG
ncbi:hypothetical protein [Neptunomonas phycophila]|uniref:hypothetical protein n=1 Tax=Neptunomonas phycophila TaxID=1572645 RepID=UPI0015BC0ABD|nr:hypothetical protein [Neptunomonas phycophila]QLE96768.1 hypothetical protein FLM49_03585 [Neptunomonas phycophila]